MYFCSDNDINDDPTHDHAARVNDIYHGGNDINNHDTLADDYATGGINDHGGNDIGTTHDGTADHGSRTYPDNLGLGHFIARAIEQQRAAQLSALHDAAIDAHLRYVASWSDDDYAALRAAACAWVAACDAVT